MREDLEQITDGEMFLFDLSLSRILREWAVEAQENTLYILRSANRNY